MARTGISLALLSAALFGASMSFAKFLPGQVEPAMMAELSYLDARRWNTRSGTATPTHGFPACKHD